MIISMNGTLVDEQQAVVSVYDHGFLYGLGLFETFRTYSTKPFLLQQHLERLSASCRELSIQYAPQEDRIRELIQQLLTVNELQDAYIRLTVSAGKDILGLPSGDYVQPTEIMYIKPLPPKDEKAYQIGKALQLLKLSRNTPEGIYRFKSLHYMNNILAKRELQNYSWAQGAEGLFLTDEGYLAEGIVSNLFFVKNSVCYTPSLDTGILPGITRAFVLKVLQHIQVPAEEGLYTWEDLVQADEVFIVNSIQEITPISTLYTPTGTSLHVGQARTGPLANRLISEYRRHTGSETG
ncbi:aminodeoxychorismate lyase [Paenibacillus hexagrammi]|uniref:Aminodeoxychorismate lyase n=1 Tax=Paenibacillus hexagrammi TaxID=2908839 RepID=A0ABY3SHW2_9BACL|nr:aminodeoxychorismate lyase [Paenibacillus sp. YPD9-1]UJF33095.1 aminodeoxychorismate lyase [Paenibacillus sp. YPD9-1]